MNIPELLSRRMRIESNIRVDSYDDDKVYSFVKSKLLYRGWNPLKIKEYSYRILII